MTNGLIRSAAALILVGIALLALAGLRPADANPPEVFGAAQSNGVFITTSQSLGNQTSQGLALGDLDSINGLDAFVANSAGGNRVWLNDGSGYFSSNSQILGTLNGQDVALGNLDGDSDLDAVVANNNGSNQVWINNGSGQFSAGQSFDSSTSRGIALGDLDGVNGLDVFVANSLSNTVWINNGGVLSDTGQSLGASNSYGVALGDLDGDNDLDAFVVNDGGDKVWINQGGAQSGTPGVFADSGQSLGSAWSYAVDLADLDGDNDLDAFTANWFPNGNKVWINQGGAQLGTQGIFSDSGQTLGSAASIGVALGDLNGVNGPDAFVANNAPDGGMVWFNDGSGQFSDSGQTLGTTTSYDVGLGDLDGDSDLDAFVANFGPNRVYLNGASVPSATFDVDRETNDNGDEVYYWAVADDATLPVLLSQPALLPLDVYADIDSASGSLSQTIPFAAGQQIAFLNLVNPMPDPNETFTLTLSVTTTGVLPGPGDQTDRLVLAFIDAGQGPSTCYLCYVEWLGRFLGFDPQFGAMHQVDIAETQALALNNYYAALHDLYAPEISNIVASNPTLLWSSLNTLDEWTPGVESLGNGTGDTITITQQMVDDGIGLLNGIKGQASQGLQVVIQHEQDALNLPSFVGLNMNQAWNQVMVTRNISGTFLTVILK